jgi:uncharacterized protein YrrD
MYKGKDLIGRPIVTRNTGEAVGTVVDLIFDREEHRLLGFLLDKGGWFSNAKVLPLHLIEAIVSDAITAASASAIQCASTFPAIQGALAHRDPLTSVRIVTLDGRTLGTIVDVYFDGQTGKIAGYEASGGIFTASHGQGSFVPAAHILTIEEASAFVLPEVADLLERQIEERQKVVYDTFGEIPQTAKDQNLAQPEPISLQERSANSASTQEGHHHDFYAHHHP